MDKRKRETDERGRYYCNSCARWKEPTGFYSTTRNGKEIHRSTCKICMKADKKYKEARKARIAAGIEINPKRDPMEWIRELAAQKRGNQLAHWGGGDRELTKIIRTDTH